MGKKPQITLYGLPYAGGSQYSYLVFQDHLPSFIRIEPVDLPGHGLRSREPLLTDIDDMVEDVFSQTKDRLNTPYAIYGHSMGGYLGYLLTKRIIAEHLPLPLHLFFSGCRGPSAEVRAGKRDISRLSKQEFIAALRQLEGTPDAVLDDDALMDFFEPILRADFQAVENYIYDSTPPFDVPITLMRGIKESITDEEIRYWQKETTQNISIHQFPDGHFFIYPYIKDVCQIISDTLGAYINVSST